MPTARLILLPVAALSVCAPAQAMVYLSVEQAQQLMYGGQALTPLLLTLTPEQAAQVERDSGVQVFSRSLRAWKAADGGAFLVDAVIGKHDLITYALAIAADGKLRQVEILEYREAYGGEVRNPRWRAQFAGKQHGDALHLGQDIDGISGATLSCEHLTDGIRRMLATYALVIRGR
jgi:Na+-translocating ferredoxin:NAD+ oxidoreductase RnfG subunit